MSTNDNYNNNNKVKSTIFDYLNISISYKNNK